MSEGGKSSSRKSPQQVDILAAALTVKPEEDNKRINVALCISIPCYL